MFYTYVVQSESAKKYYIGSTADLEKRLTRHNSGYTKSIRDKAPYRVVYYEIFKTRTEAYRRERQIKSYKGGKAFKKLLEVR